MHYPQIVVLICADIRWLRPSLSSALKSIQLKNWRVQESGFPL